jgi:hypothetical protein
MLKADAKRITLFLGLQRLLHIPRYFMAAPKIRRQSKHPVTPDLNAVHRGIPLIRDEKVTSGRFHAGPAFVVPAG